MCACILQVYICIHVYLYGTSSQRLLRDYLVHMYDYMHIRYIHIIYTGVLHICLHVMHACILHINVCIHVYTYSSSVQQLFCDYLVHIYDYTHCRYVHITYTCICTF